MQLPEFKPDIHSKDPGKNGYLNLGLGESPYGMSPKAHQTFIKAANRLIPYPDSSGTSLAEEIGSFYGLNPESVFLGNGIDEVILAAGLAFLGQGDECLINRSTFAGFEAAVKIAKATPLYAEIEESGVIVEAIAKLLKQKPRLWFFCNPHNPTGSVLDKSALEYLFTIAEQNGVIIVVDEAYAEYADPACFQSAISQVNRYSNIIVMRTFSKIYGLAGLRCGYAVGDMELIQQLWKIKHVLPFSVNRFALEVAAVALEDQSFVKECYRQTNEVKEFFYSALNKLGFPYIPSHTNFVLVRFDRDIEWVCEELKENHRILIRSANPFGLPYHARITLGTLHQMQRLADALHTIKEASHGPFRIAF